jgi:hypothetical protein
MLCGRANESSAFSSIEYEIVISDSRVIRRKAILWRNAGRGVDNDPTVHGSKKSLRLVEVWWSFRAVLPPREGRYLSFLPDARKDRF